MAERLEIVILGKYEAKKAFDDAAKGAAGLGKEVEGAGQKVDEAGKKVEGLDSKLKTFGGSAQKAGALMTAGITAPLMAAGLASVDAASDMAESQSKVGVVFGESAGIITDFAAGAAENLGMSSQAATEAAGTYGNLFTSMGIGQEKAAGMSTELLQLAADLGSFNNIDPTEALEKLRAGLVGETEPLRSLGVNLNADAIEAKALEMGLGKVTTTTKDNSAAAKELAKAQADLTALTTGHGKASEEAAAAMLKVRGAELDVATAQKALNQAIKDHGKNSLQAKEAAQTLAEKQAVLTQRQRDYNDVVNGYGPASEKVIAAQARVAEAQAKVNTNVSKSTTELSAADKAQAAYALILEQTKNAQGDYARTADGLANSQRTMKAEMANLSAELGVMLLPIMKDLVGTVRSVIGAFQGLSPETQRFILIGAGILAALGPVVGIIGTVSTVVGFLIPVFGALAAVITGTVLPALGALVVAIGWPILIIAAVVAAVVGLYLAYQSNFLGIRDIVDSVIAWMGPFITNAINTIKATWETVWNAIRGVVTTVWEGIKLAVGIYIGLVTGIITAAMQALSGDWSGAWNTLKSTLSTAWESMKGLVRTNVNAIIGFINRLIGAWNGLSFKIPGFSVNLPSVNVPGVGTIGGGHLGWGGVNIQTPNISSIPTLDTGGIVSEPTLAMLAANRRPEAVIPLDKLKGLGGTVEYHLHLEGTHTSSVRSEFAMMELLWGRA